jgi:hypothetical protein
LHFQSSSKDHLAGSVPHPDRPFPDPADHPAKLIPDSDFIHLNHLVSGSPHPFFGAWFPESRYFRMGR